MPPSPQITGKPVAGQRPVPVWQTRDEAQAADLCKRHKGKTYHLREVMPSKSCWLFWPKFWEGHPATPGTASRFLQSVQQAPKDKAYSEVQA